MSNELQELGTGWTIEGDTATRGAVVVVYQRNSGTAVHYRARVFIPEIGTISMTAYTAVDALGLLRDRLATEFPRYDNVANKLAAALAAIDAPDAPEVQ